MTECLISHSKVLGYPPANPTHKPSIGVNSEIRNNSH